jgi:hypothetical protein
MITQNKPLGDTVSWLLGHENPGVRYLARRDLLRLAPDNPELVLARRLAHSQGPIAKVLSHMDPTGYWSQPGPGYNPKYFSTVWSIILLAQLGGSVHEDERIAAACRYLLENNLTDGGQFSTSGAPSGTVDCLQGNLCWALTELGCTDERLLTAYEWMARTVTGEGIAPVTDKRAAVRYYAGKCGPVFNCGANNGRSCAWGAAKVMLAFLRLPMAKVTPLDTRAVQIGVDFLLSVDPASAAYPTASGEKPNRSWWKIGFPVFYVTDILQLLEVLVSLGYAQDARLNNARNFILNKQDDQGRWALEYHYNDKTWVDFGAPGQPNPWVTLRALRTLSPYPEVATSL